jgi:hypothetical protein
MIQRKDLISMTSEGWNDYTPRGGYNRRRPESHENAIYQHFRGDSQLKHPSVKDQKEFNHESFYR